MKTFTLCLILLMAGSGVLLVPAPALAAVVFSDDFESQPAVNVNNTAFPDPGLVDAFPRAPTGAGGSWSKVYDARPANNAAVQVTKYATPGPYQDNNYVRSIQTLPTYCGWQANFPAQTQVGDLIRVDAQFNFPTNVGCPLEIEAINASTFTYALEVDADKLSNTVWDDRSMVPGPTGGETNTGVPYAIASWSHWQIDYRVGASTLTLTVGTNSAAGILVANPGEINAIRLEQTSFATGGFCVDNFSVANLGQVPEPSCIVLLLSALVGPVVYAWRKRR